MNWLIQMNYTVFVENEKQQTFSSVQHSNRSTTCFLSNEFDSNFKTKRISFRQYLWINTKFEKFYLKHYSYQSAVKNLTYSRGNDKWFLICKISRRLFISFNKDFLRSILEQNLVKNQIVQDYIYYFQFIYN